MSPKRQEMSTSHENYTFQLISKPNLPTHIKTSTSYQNPPPHIKTSLAAQSLTCELSMHV